MNLHGHRIAACLGKAALKTHALQTLSRRPPTRPRARSVWSASDLSALSAVSGSWSPGHHTGLRQLTDQPAVFAARRLFDLLHFAECDLKIIAQLTPDALLNCCQPRTMKPGSGDVAKFRNTRPFLVELHRIQV